MLYIYGHGGFAREVAAFLPKKLSDHVFVIDDNYYQQEDSNNRDAVVKYSELLKYFDDECDTIAIAIGDPIIRREIVTKLLNESRVKLGLKRNLYLKRQVLGNHIASGGNIFCPGSILTTDIRVGSFNHFNLNSTIGHDCIIGSYNTFSPGVNISGNVKVGDLCYFGTNSSVKEGVSICDNVTIGMGAVVLNNIEEAGTYVGVPCKKIYSTK